MFLLAWLLGPSQTTCFFNVSHLSTLLVLSVFENGTHLLCDFPIHTCSSLQLHLVDACSSLSPALNPSYWCVSLSAVCFEVDFKRFGKPEIRFSERSLLWQASFRIPLMSRSRAAFSQTRSWQHIATTQLWTVQLTEPADFFFNLSAVSSSYGSKCSFKTVTILSFGFLGCTKFLHTSSRPLHIIAK